MSAIPTGSTRLAVWSLPGYPLRDEEQEGAVVAAFRRGEVDSLAPLARLHMPRAISIAHSVVGNVSDAEDLAQEGFLRAWSRRGSFTRGDQFGPWLFRIVTNLALDLLKHRRRVKHEELSYEDAGPRQDEPDTMARSREIASRVTEALAELPAAQKTVATLFLVQGFEHAEIAQLLSLTEGTVRSHLSLARRKLQERLKELHGGGR